MSAVFTRAPAARTAMLIRRPVAEVFEAWVDPAVLARIWFTRSSGRLVAGTRVEWTWEMYGFTVPVDVRVVEPNARIVVDWGDESGTTTVEWRFRAVDGRGTFVEIEHSGFAGDPDQVVREVSDTASGFSFVLAAMKALLEHGVELNVVADRHPFGLEGG